MCKPERSHKTATCPCDEDIILFPVLLTKSPDLDEGVLLDNAISIETSREVA
jgi:hypothetical protein